MSDSDDCALKSSRFIGQVNRLLGNFGFLSSDVLSRLFTAYCTSFYGSQLWTLGSNSWNKVIVEWRKAVRRVLKLPYQTHTWLLPALLNRPPLQCSLEIRFVRFFSSLMRSNNRIMKLLALRARHSASTWIGRNVAFLRDTRGVDFDVDTDASAIDKVIDHHQLPEDRTPVAVLAVELLRIREQELYVEGFDLEIDLLLRAICVE